jgi:hypothetical protein
LGNGAGGKSGKKRAIFGHGSTRMNTDKTPVKPDRVQPHPCYAELKLGQVMAPGVLFLTGIGRDPGFWVES